MEIVGDSGGLEKQLAKLLSSDHGLNLHYILVHQECGRADKLTPQGLPIARSACPFRTRRDSPCHDARAMGADALHIR